MKKISSINLGQILQNPIENRRVDIMAETNIWNKGVGISANHKTHIDAIPKSSPAYNAIST